MTMLLMITLISGPWTLSMDLGLNLNQSYYSENWQGDETGTISWTTFLNLSASKPIGRKMVFSNSTKLAFN